MQEPSVLRKSCGSTQKTEELFLPGGEPVMPVTVKATPVVGMGTLAEHVATIFPGIARRQLLWQMRALSFRGGATSRTSTG